MVPSPEKRVCDVGVEARVALRHGGGVAVVKGSGKRSLEVFGARVLRVFHRKQKRGSVVWRAHLLGVLIGWKPEIFAGHENQLDHVFGHRQSFEHGRAERGCVEISGSFFVFQRGEVGQGHVG